MRDCVQGEASAKSSSQRFLKEKKNVPFFADRLCPRQRRLVASPSYHTPVDEEDAAGAEHGEEVEDLVVTKVGGEGVGPLVNKYRRANGLSEGLNYKQ